MNTFQQAPVVAPDQRFLRHYGYCCCQCNKRRLPRDLQDTPQGVVCREGCEKKLTSAAA